MQLTGTPAGTITLNYIGGGPGPFIIHNRASWGANVLFVDIDNIGALSLGSPAVGDGFMFAAFGNPATVRRVTL
jgi:hypothetical protein